MSAAVSGATLPMVTLAGTDLSVSRFVFGTASLFNAGGAGDREALLRAAVDAGFTHFDTAPYYGFGAAERDLAPVLRDNPQVTVTTKVGIYSPGGERQPDWAIFARKAIGRFLKPVSRPAVDFALGRAQAALSASLERLGCERVAIYMLHEPRIDLVATDEWQRWLEDEQRRGRVGAFGLALEAHLLEPFLRHAPGLAGVVQVLDSLDRREADLLSRHGHPLQITYGYVSAARARGDERPVATILAEALARNPAGAIIVSTRRADRLGQYADLFAA